MTSEEDAEVGWCRNCDGAAHGALLYLALLILLCHTHCCRTPPSAGGGRGRGRKALLLHNHIGFWLISLLLFLIHVAIMAAVWLDRGMRGVDIVQLVTPALGALAVGGGGVVHRVVESSGSHPGWLSPLLLYHVVLAGLTLAKVKVKTGTTSLVPGMSSSSEGLNFLGQLNLILGMIALIQGILLGVAILRGRRKWKKEDEEEDRMRMMLGEEAEEQVYAHDHAPLLSRLTFFWFTGLLTLGYSTPLEESHLGRLPPAHTTSRQLARFKALLQPQEPSELPSSNRKKDVEILGGSEEKKRETRPLGLWTLLWTVVGPNMALGGLFRLLADLAGFVAPLGIKTIVNWSGRNRTMPLQGVDMEMAGEEGHLPLTLTSFVGNGYVMVGLVLVASLLQATFSQCSTYLVNTEGLHVKAALQGLIYEKCVRVVGRGEETANLVGEDANNVMMLFWMAHFVWAIPLKLTVLMGLLWGTLGWSALLAAALCILIMLPLQFLIARAMAANSKLLLERSDERLGWMGEMVANMRLLKAHAWEPLFGKRLGEIRAREMKHLDNDLLYRSIMTFLTHISTVVVTLVTFGLYPVLEEDRLEPAAVFAGLAFFNQLTVPLFIFPLLVPVLIDATVSGGRIAEFLSLPEMESESLNVVMKEDQRPPPPPPPLAPSTPTGQGQSPRPAVSTDSVFLENIAEDEEEEDEEERELDIDHDLYLDHEVHLGKGSREEVDWVVRLENASFSWDDAGEVPVLSGISLEIRREALTVVVGPTGSGKSSLLSALLGELKRTSGRLAWSRGGRCQVAYAAQSPWILNGTVRENILFGRGFKGRRYKRVIEAVSLQHDLELLPEGDGTEIGDHGGIGLSGGQKQRIAIARALYSTAPLVILDDPLSALDVEVAAHVLDIGIRKLLARRTVLLVSHHLPVLHHAHHIVAMDGGRIRIQGSLPEIKIRDPDLASHWGDLISKKEAELARYMIAKTAKERWTLLKLVSKIGFRAKRAQQNQEEARMGSQSHFRSRKGTFSTYKNLSHDFFLPSDECHDDLLSPILRRRRLSRASRDSRTSASSSKHVALMRMSSLQPGVLAGTGAGGGGGGYSSANKFNRLRSMPAPDDEPLPPPISPRRFRSEINRLHASNNEPLFKRLFSYKKTVSSTGSSDLEPLPHSLSPYLLPHPQPRQLPLPTLPSSSLQSEGELTEDDPQEGDELLGGSVEEREYGSVPLRIYLIYGRACGRLLSLSYLIFAIGYEVVRVLTSFWLSRWSDSVAQEEDDTVYDARMSHFFTVYVLLSIATVGVSLTCNLLGKAAGGRSRRLLHDHFVSRLLDAPLSFFESTPIGRILGRASADVAVVDRKLVISVQRFLQFVFLCLSAVVVNGVVNPWFLLLAAPLVAIYYAIQRFYRVSSRELQRLQAISRGPILSHFHETLQGLSTIRAFGRQRIFTQHMFACIDLNNRADMFINVGNRWLSISLDYLGSVIVAVASVGAVVSADLGLVTPSVVGLAINYTLLVPVYLNWVVKFLAEVEMFMNSVDRLDRYSELEKEEEEPKEPTTPPPQPPPSWPTKGALELEKVSISFEENTVVSSLSLSVPGGQKVGLCGRSGCGKSTLLSSLFRLSGRVEGRILIDGVDILTLPRRRLRSSLCIIPQTSVLFTAPLRFNLDPSGGVSDPELWRALELAQMKEVVFQLPHQLDQIMSPDSFSSGQRQLIALAVAILHPSRVVVMDEVTSSVDADTEQTLLRVVATAFKDSTVLSIAHRLGTLVEGDRVVVLEEGKVVEDGAPSKLLAQKSKSIFANMLRAEVQSAAHGGQQ